MDLVSAVDNHNHDIPDDPCKTLLASCNAHRNRRQHCEVAGDNLAEALEGDWTCKRSDIGLHKTPEDGWAHERNTER